MGLYTHIGKTPGSDEFGAKFAGGWEFFAELKRYKSNNVVEEKLFGESEIYKLSIKDLDELIKFGVWEVNPTILPGLANTMYLEKYNYLYFTYDY